MVTTQHSTGIRFFILLLIVYWLQACGGGKTSNNFVGEVKVNSTSSGVKFKFFTHNQQARHIQKGDLISFYMQVQNQEDTILSQQHFKEYPFKKPYFISKEYFKDIFSQLCEGDSIAFWIHTDSLLNKPGYLEDPRIPKHSHIKWTVKVNKIQSTDDVKKKLEEDLKVQREIDHQLITKYIQKIQKEDSTFAFNTTHSGLCYFFEQEGQGDNPLEGDTVSINYISKFLDGTIYGNSGNDGTTEFLVGNISPTGLDEGIKLMKSGTKGTFILPSELGYGPKGIGTVVPPNAILIFDVELIKIN